MRIFSLDSLCLDSNYADLHMSNVSSLTKIITKTSLKKNKNVREKEITVTHTRADGQINSWKGSCGGRGVNNFMGKHKIITLGFMFRHCLSMARPARQFISFLFVNDVIQNQLP